MLKKIGFTLSFLIPLFDYLATLSPTVNFVDSGELMVATQFLGIAHPTGYPLFTILGHLFSFLPYGTFAFRINSFSAFWGGLTCGFVFLSMYSLFDKYKITPFQLFFISLSAAWLCGSSLTLWQNATQIEVYSLTAFLFSLLIYLTFAWLKNKNPRYLLLISFFVGVGLGNHLSLVWLIPGMITLVFFAWRNREHPNSVFIFSGVLLGIGLSIYFFLPVRTSPYLPLNWGAPYNPERFLWHITGKQYRVWMFEANFLDKFPDYFVLLTRQWTPYLIWIGFPGIFIQFDRLKKPALLLTITWIVNVVFALNYSIPDIDSYFIPSFIIWSLWMGVALMKMIEWIPSTNLKNIFAVLIVGLFIIPTSLDWAERSKNKNHLAENLGRNVLNTVEANAIVFSDIWDIKSTTFFLQQLEHVRPDVWVIDFPLMKRSWYIQQLLVQHPKELQYCRDSFEIFLKEVEPFEHDRPYQSQVIERAYVGMVNCIIEQSIVERPIYYDFPSYPGIAEKYDKIPTGFFFRISQSELPLNQTSATVNYEGLSEQKMLDVQDGRIKEILSRYWIYAWFRGNYAYNLQDFNEAVTWFERAAKLNPVEKRIIEVLEKAKKEREPKKE